MDNILLGKTGACKPSGPGALRLLDSDVFVLALPNAEVPGSENAKTPTVPPEECPPPEETR